EVLFRDDRDRDVVDVHLVLANEVNQQVERPLEGIELDLVGVWRRLEVGALGMFGHGQYLSFTASRTRSRVACAITRALRAPSTVPGMSARIRFGSVYICRTFFVTSSAVSVRSIVLP